MTTDPAYDGYREWKQWTRLFDPLPHESTLFAKEFRGIPIEGKRWLDIGFGSGSLLGWARSQGASVAGIEIQADLRKAAETQGIATFDSLESVPDASFDIITAFDVLEHIPREDLVSFLTHVRRTTAANAIIVVRFPNCQSAAGLINQFGDATHVTMLSGPIIEQLAAKAGLKSLHVRASEAMLVPVNFPRALARAIQKLARCISNLAFRFIWSSGSTPLSANVTVVLSRQAAEQK